MDRNFNEQQAELTKKAKDFAEKMRVSQCEPNTALYAYYNNCFIKGMEYCMPVTNFTKKRMGFYIKSSKNNRFKKIENVFRIPKGCSLWFN